MLGTQTQVWSACGGPASAVLWLKGWNTQWRWGRQLRLCPWDPLGVAYICWWLATYHQTRWYLPSSMFDNKMKKNCRKGRHTRIPLLHVFYCTGVYFLMLGQVIVAYKGFPTFVTLVALVIMVYSEVEPVHGTLRGQSNWELESQHHITNTADTFFPLSVNPPVGAAMTETLTADTTQVRFLPTVDPHVLPQRCPGSRNGRLSMLEGFSDTEQTHWHRPKHPSALPHGTDVPFPHWFPTDKTGPLSLASVSTLNVSLPVACVIELSATDLTGKRTWRRDP